MNEGRPGGRSLGLEVSRQFVKPLARTKITVCNLTTKV